MAFRKNIMVRNYFILPCCLLLLNLGNSVISYKAQLIHNPLLQTAFIMFMVLAGSSLVAYAFSPAVEAMVGAVHKSSRRHGGTAGEALFLLVLGVGIFWLYYAAYIHGPQTLLPMAWRNH